MNWAKIAVGAYLLSPFSPDDFLTFGATTVPGAIIGSYIIADGMDALPPELRVF